MPHKEKFKIAVVGISTEPAEEFLAEIFDSKSAKLVAVCDENDESLKQICETYVVNGYHTYEDLIENENIDFAVITVKHGTRTSENPAKKSICKK